MTLMITNKALVHVHVRRSEGPGTIKLGHAHYCTQSHFSTIHVCTCAFDKKKMRLRTKVRSFKLYGTKVTVRFSLNYYKCIY